MWPRAAFGSFQLHVAWCPAMSPLLLRSLPPTRARQPTWSVDVETGTRPNAMCTAYALPACGRTALSVPVMRLWSRFFFAARRFLAARCFFAALPFFTAFALALEAVAFVVAAFALTTSAGAETAVPIAVPSSAGGGESRFPEGGPRSGGNTGLAGGGAGGRGGEGGGGGVAGGGGGEAGGGGGEAGGGGGAGGGAGGGVPELTPLANSCVQ